MRMYKREQTRERKVFVLFYFSFDILFFKKGNEYKICLQTQVFSKSQPLQVIWLHRVCVLYYY